MKTVGDAALGVGVDRNLRAGKNERAQMRKEYEKGKSAKIHRCERDWYKVNSKVIDSVSR